MESAPFLHLLCSEGLSSWDCSAHGLPWLVLIDTPVSTVRLSGRSLGFAAAAATVLPVVPAVQLCLSVQLLLPHGEDLAAGWEHAVRVGEWFVG